MDRGDLSATLAPVVGMRFEAVLYNFGQLNEPGKGYLDRLMAKNINLYLVSLLPEKKVRAWCYKWGVMYTKVLTADSILEIPALCRAHKMMLYIDTDDHLLEAVAERGNPRTETLKWEQTLEPRSWANTEADRGRWI